MWGAQRRVSLDVLMACWGLGAWLGVNGLYVQLPLLVERLPERWALPASMVLAIQLANAGPLAYGLLKHLMPVSRDAPYIYGVLGFGTLALVLNAFLHERTTVLAGAERSLAFLALTFCSGLVGCTSSVLFYPHLRHYRDVYLATYLAGEGLGGFVPSLLALAQGVGGEPECLPSGPGGALQALHPPPRFSTLAFLLLLAALSAASLVSFALIGHVRAFRSERAVAVAGAGAGAGEGEPAAKREAGGAPPSAHWLGGLALVATVNALSNGVLPSVQSYSCMPYGRRTYHLAVTLSALANPAACLAGVWLRPLSRGALALLLGAAGVPLGYIVATALLSPAPPLAGSGGGAALVVCAWVATSGALSYARMWLYGWARGGGARGMRACGASTQLGSALGSGLLYYLVNHTLLFTQPAACAEPL